MVNQINNQQNQMKVNQKNENTQAELNQVPSVSTQTRKTKLCIIVSIIITVLVVAAITTTVVLLTAKSNEEEETVIEEQEEFCDRYPQQCQGVNQDVINLIKSKDYDDDGMNSMLQVARDYQEIGQNSSKSTQTFFKLFRSLECASAIFGENYLQNVEEMHNIYLNNTQKLDQYISMIDEVNGEPIARISQDQQLFNCNFQLSPDRRRRMQANSDKCLNNSSNAVLHFINGVGFTAKGAQQNVEEIEKAANQKGLSFSSFICSAAWRKEKGILRDLIDVIIMKVQEKANQKGEQVINGAFKIKRILLFFLGDFIDKDSEELLTDEDYQEVILNEYNNFVNDLITTPDISLNVDKHVEFVNENIREGKKVVFVAHSQGTMYANIIYAKLDISYWDNVAMLFLGAAANKIADGNDLYITNSADLVILSLTALSLKFPIVPRPLLPNQLPKVFSILSHDCVGYIRNFNKEFKQKLEKAYNLAEIPSATQSDGTITVELTWDDQPDLDLHVFQPSGSHIYYADKAGVAGYLDVDDINGFGPQHYYTSCETMEQGVYQIKLNYYLGIGQSFYTVKVKAGSIMKIIDGKTGSIALGGQGDSNPPINLFRIKVTVNEIWGNYEYEVIEA